MNRRQGIIAVLAASVGLLSRKANADGTTDKAFMVIQLSNPRNITFNLDGFKDFTFTQGIDTVTLSPEEIMAAIKG